jgi:hypothetical protein
MIELEIASKLVLNAIKKEYGFNFDKNGNVVKFDKGFMVGGFHKCLKFEKTDTLGLDVGITKMLFILRKEFDNDYVLGWWEKGGYIYLDISSNILDFENALWLGFNQNQKAIYDLENDKEIEIDKTISLTTFR